MIETIGAIAVAVFMAVSNLMNGGLITEKTETTTSEVKSGYEQEAQERIDDATEYLNNEIFSEENKEELRKKGIEIRSIDVRYERSEDDDSIYKFRADVSFNEHTVTEILVIDLEDDDELEYYGLVDDELLTPERAEYYRNLLSTN